MTEHIENSEPQDGMKTWWVSYPTAGTVTVEVEADSEEAAIEAGWEKVSDGDHTWEAMKHIVRGNVFYGQSNDIEVGTDD